MKMEKEFIYLGSSDNKSYRLIDTDTFEAKDMNFRFVRHNIDRIHNLKFINNNIVAIDKVISNSDRIKRYTIISRASGYIIITNFTGNILIFDDIDIKENVDFFTNNKFTNAEFNISSGNLNISFNYQDRLTRYAYNSSDNIGAEIYLLRLILIRKLTLHNGWYITAKFSKMNGNILKSNEKLLVSINESGNYLSLLQLQKFMGTYRMKKRNLLEQTYLNRVLEQSEMPM